MSEHDDDTCPHLVRASLLEAENARLKAENERIRKLFYDTERLMLIDGEYEAAKVGTYADLKSENARLQAEVERLRKAGDAMAEALNLNDDVFDNQDKKEAQANWRAAKEGKQP